MIIRAPLLKEFNKPLIFHDLELEDPGRGEVTLEVKACGLCLTDVHICEGHIPTVTLPHVLGHEFSGVILKRAQSLWISKSATGLFQV